GPCSGDGARLCPAQFPGAPKPLVTHGLIGINSNEVDDTEYIPTLPEGPRSSVLDEIDGPHVLVNPAWAQAVALGRWPSQVRPSSTPALGGILFLRSVRERPPDNQVRSVI